MTKLYKSKFGKNKLGLTPSSRKKTSKTAKHKKKLAQRKKQFKNKKIIKRQAEFLKFNNTRSFIDLLTSGKYETTRGRDTRGKHLWEPFIRFKEEFDGEKSWGAGHKQAPKWLVKKMLMQGIIGKGDSRKIDAIGIVPIGWDIKDHKDWSIEPESKYKTFCTQEYAADRYQTIYKLGKNKDDFVKLWDNPCQTDSFRLNIYNKKLSKEWHKQYKDANRQPDVRKYDNFVNSDIEYDRDLWKFIHKKITNTDPYKHDKLFEARHKRQTEIINNRLKSFRKILISPKRVTGWDHITGGVGKTPMAAETISQALMIYRPHMKKLTGTNLALILHGYHSRQCLTQNDTKKQRWHRAAGLYYDTLAVTKATLEDAYLVPYDQEIDSRKIADRILKAIVDNEQILNLPYLYHHSKILDKAIDLVKREYTKFKPFIRWKDEIDWAVGSIDSNFRPGYDIECMGKPIIDYGDTATKIENEINGMNRVDIVGIQNKKNTVTLMQAAKMGMTAFPRIYLNYDEMSNFIEKLKQAGVKVKFKKNGGGDPIPDLDQYVGSEFIIHNGNKRYMTLYELCDLIKAMDFVKDNPTNIRHMLLTNTLHNWNDLFYKNWQWLLKNYFNDHPNLTNIHHSFYKDEDTEDLAGEVTHNIDTNQRTAHWFVYKASRGFDVTNLDTYIPFGIKNYRTMAQEYMRVLRLGLNPHGNMVFNLIANDLNKKEGVDFKKVMYEKFNGLTELGLPVIDYIQSEFKSKSKPGKKTPPGPFVLNKPASISLSQLKSLITNNVHYRNTFEVNEYSEASDWYTSQIALCENPLDTALIKVIQDEFAIKFETLWRMSIQPKKGKKITQKDLKNFGAGVAKGTHRFLKDYDRVQDNVRFINKLKQDYKTKRKNMFDTLSEIVRREADKPEHRWRLEKPKDAVWHKFENAIIKKYKLKTNASRKSQWGYLWYGERTGKKHNPFSEQIAQDHQEWYMLRENRVASEIIKVTDWLCAQDVLPLYNVLESKFKHLPKILLENIFWKGSKFNNLPKALLQRTDIRDAMKKWLTHWKVLHGGRCNTKQIWDTCQRWYKDEAPPYFLADSTNAGTKAPKRDEYIQAQLKKQGIDITLNEIHYNLAPLRGKPYPAKKHNGDFIHINSKDEKTNTKTPFRINVTYQAKMEQWKIQREKYVNGILVQSYTLLKAKKKTLTDILNNLGGMPGSTYRARLTAIYGKPVNTNFYH